MSASFEGGILPRPELRFSYSTSTARESNARRGLGKWGPYDWGLRDKESIRCAMVAQPASQRNYAQMRDGLTNGVGAFPGFKSLFRMPLDIIGETLLPDNRDETLLEGIHAVIRDEVPDLVLVSVPGGRPEVYGRVKAELLGHGIPNQVVTPDKLDTVEQGQWKIQNIALALYGKTGGTPWVVAAEDNRKELTIGIGRSQDRDRNFVVGFVTLFTNDGDFVFLSSLAPKPIEWEEKSEYVEALRELIVQSYREYCRSKGAPDSIVLHLCKSPGRSREVEAARLAVMDLGVAVPVALLHLNEDSTFRLFDTTSPTFVPPAGISVTLADNECVVLFEQAKNQRGMPRTLHVRMDSRSTMDVEEFPRLVRQLGALSQVNWRGFNARSIPATINYSKLVAQLVAEVGRENWNAIAAQGKLRDKAWFL